MPSATETAGESARTASEERTFLADEAVPQVLDGRWPGERLTERDLRVLSFEAGVSDAFGSGWPSPL